MKPKVRTLTLNKEFKRAYYRGKRRVSPYFFCYIVKNRHEGIRYGLTASKKLGNAVERNRARRLLRTAFLTMEFREKENWDFVFVARERILSAKMPQVAKAMEKALFSPEGEKEAPQKTK